MNPYENLPAKAFWRSAVANKSMFDIGELWDPKFNVRQHENIVTFGSCFAQHIGTSLKSRGFKWLIAEQAPTGSNESLARKFGYHVFSARTGNIYTTSLLKQWTEWALGKKEIPKEAWAKDGRYYDPFRPRVEPNGFESEEELCLSRLQAIRSFKECIERANYFVFTLGLTESWINQEEMYEYPMCPGTAAGTFDENKHKFVNQPFGQILESLSSAMALMTEVNPQLRFIFTVSPVPLTATKSGKHVLTATVASKSILRAVVEQLTANRKNVDYFPSYEIISSPVFKGVFFEPNQRNVNPHGVKHVMDQFFTCLASKFGTSIAEHNMTPQIIDDERLEGDEACEEAVLQQYAK